MGKDSTAKPPRPTVVVVQQQQQQKQKGEEEEVGGCMRCMYSCFGAFRVNSLLGCIDHETGVKIIAWLLLAVTAASIVADFFLVSIFLLYWQVVGFIINVSLLYGVKVRRIEFFLPWLVKVAIGSLILPAAAIYVFIRYRDSPTDGERVAALFSISLFFPFMVLCLYFFVVVMSLFQRYGDPKDPLYAPSRRKAAEKRRAKKNAERAKGDGNNV